MKTPALFALLSASLAFAQLPHDGNHVRTDDHGRVAVALEGVTVERSTPLLPVSLESAWTAIGPFGGDVTDVAARPGDESTVLAGTAPSGGLGGSLYRSTNSGGTWTEVGVLSGLSVYDIEFAADGTAYVGTIDGVWRSIDGGANWTALPLGIGVNDQVLDVELDPSLPGRLWLGVADALGSQTQVVLRSDNGGATWVNASPPGSGLGCAAVAVDPANSDRVFAAMAGGFGGGAVYRSLNAGSSWTNVTGILPQNPMGDIVVDGARVLVCGGQLFGSQTVGLYESTNDGLTWSALHDGTWPLLVINDIEIDPADGARLFVGSAGAGVFRSTDGGATWDFGVDGTGALTVNEVSVAPSGTSPIYLGNSSAAIFKSTGGDFLPSSEGLSSLDTVSIRANPLNADELAVAFQGQNDGGVYTSLDGGVSWTLESLPGTRFNSVAFAPDGTLYANSDGPTTVAPESVYRRSGGSWTSIGPDQGSAFESRLGEIIFSEFDPNLIYTVGADFGVAGFEATIWKSTDAGAMWTKVYESVEANETVRDLEIFVDIVDVVPGTEDQFLVACFEDTNQQTGGALYSDDSGLTWQPSSGLPTGAQGTSLALWKHQAPLGVYLADNDFGAGGVWESTDGGQSWLPALNVADMESTFRVVSDPLYAERLFLGRRFTGQTKALTKQGPVLAFDEGLDASGLVQDLASTEGTCRRLLLATTTGAYARVASCFLEADGDTLSIASGGTQDFDLGAGAENAGTGYILLGTTSGTAPGTTAFGITVPLNLDFYLLLSLSNPGGAPLFNNVGTLNGNGQTTAGFFAPGGLLDPSLAGVTLHHAYVLYDITTIAVQGASNAVALQLVP